jgi:DNA-directed RNA polymerase subunit E'/Rpb7
VAAYIIRSVMNKTVCVGGGSYFNVNFNIVFLKQLTSASIGE